MEELGWMGEVEAQLSVGISTLYCVVFCIVFFWWLYRCGTGRV